MKLIEYIKELVNGKSREELTAPEGFCPNCWGRQEYGGKLYDAVKREHIDTNNLEQKKGWIQAYAEKNLSGIQLYEKDARLVCDSCHVSYESN